MRADVDPASSVSDQENEHLLQKAVNTGRSPAVAAITIICAVVILRHPFAAAATLWMFIVLTMIVEAVIDIISVIFIRERKEDSI